MRRGRGSIVVVVASLLAVVGPVAADEPGRDQLGDVPEGAALLVTIARGEDLEEVADDLDDLEVVLDAVALPELGERVVVQVEDGDHTAAARDLLERPEVVAVEVDPPVTIARLVPTDPLWSQQWSAQVTDMPSAWARTTGADLVVAVVDTGVQPTSELAGRVLPGFNTVSGGTDTADVHGHGTMTASLLAGRGNNGIGFAGQCWGCQVLPIKALGDLGGGTMSALAAGISRAVDEGADIINISAGGPTGTTLLASAVAKAEAAGVLVVASAGNDGTDVPFYPAAYPTVLSIGASEASGVRYAWSNHGPTVDVAAPGCSRAQTPTGSFVTYCGTSAAAPFASGLLALHRSLDGAPTPAGLRELLRSTARAPVATGALPVVDGAGLLATVPVVPVAPGVPRSVTASAGDERVTVSWAAPVSDGGAPITTYEVIAAPSGARRVVAGTARSTTITGLSNGVATTVTVTATNEVGPGRASGASPAVTPLPARVSGLARSVGFDPATGTSPRPRVTLHWTNPARLDAVRVRWDDGATIRTRTLSASTTSTTITGLPVGRDVSYSVHAVRGGVESRPRTVRTTGTTLTSARSVSSLTSGTSVRITGSLTRGTTRLGGRAVRLQASTQRSDGTFGPWSHVTTTTTASDGTYAFSRSPSRTVRYRTVFLGSGQDAGRVSTARTISVRPRVTSSLSSSSVRARSTVTLSGQVSPNLAGRTVHLQRYRDGAWRDVSGQRQALSTTSRYRFTITPTSSGSVRYRVRLPAAEPHLQGVSPGRTLRVT
jgi:hypothetical protein